MVSLSTFDKIQISSEELPKVVARFAGTIGLLGELALRALVKIVYSVPRRAVVDYGSRHSRVTILVLVRSLGAHPLVGIHEVLGRAHAAMSSTGSHRVVQRLRRVTGCLTDKEDGFDVFRGVIS